MDLKYFTLDNIRDLSDDYKFESKVILPTIIKIHSKYDVWKIAYCNWGKIQLFHLNRNSIKEGTYHKQYEFIKENAKLQVIYEYIKKHDDYVENNRLKEFKDV